MIAVDTNILVLARRKEFPKHAVARARLESLAQGVEPWAIPIFVTSEFLRVVTNPKFLKAPTQLGDAIDGLVNLLRSPSARLLLPGNGYWALFQEILLQADARGNLVFDAQIVALCREHGVTTILTDDRDFKRFKGITVLHLD